MSDVNYYNRHLGDYAKDTLQLTALENGVYTFLLDSYYATEKPIPASKVYLIARAYTKAERKATESVLATFFKRKGDVWTSSRCDAEIAKAHVRIEAARANGLKGGNPNRQPTGLPTGETLQSPSSNNQEKDSEGLKTFFREIVDKQRLTPAQQARVRATKT